MELGMLLKNPMHEFDGNVSFVLIHFWLVLTDASLGRFKGERNLSIGGFFQC
jgi:hypothetical protein